MFQPNVYLGPPIFDHKPILERVCHFSEWPEIYSLLRTCEKINDYVWEKVLTEDFLKKEILLHISLCTGYKKDDDNNYRLSGRWVSQKRKREDHDIDPFQLTHDFRKLLFLCLTRMMYAWFYSNGTNSNTWFKQIWDVTKRCKKCTRFFRFCGADAVGISIPKWLK